MLLHLNMYDISFRQHLCDGCRLVLAWDYWHYSLDILLFVVPLYIIDGLLSVKALSQYNMPGNSVLEGQCIALRHN